MALINDQFALLDASEPQVRALVREYGYGRAMNVARQFYGRWADARAVLEVERELLQSQRWGNIPSNGLAGKHRG